MDFNKYTIFVEVAKQKSLSKAAATLGYSQSGISHTLKRLEKEMNLTLFHRSRNGADLTPAGEIIYPYIAQMVQCQENIHQTIDALHDLHQGTLNIGTYSSISRKWLPPIIQHFKKDYPSIKIHFMEGGIEEITGWLAAHQVDLGFFSYGTNSDFHWIPLKEDPLLAIVPKDYPLGEKSVFPLEEFNDKTFILSAQGIDIDVHKTLEKHRLHPEIQYTAKDDYTILSMVACDLGISILPQLILPDNNPNIKALALDPPTVRQLGIAIPSLELASPATLKFIDYAKDYIFST